jgi:hypothetical protein
VISMGFYGDFMGFQWNTLVMTVTVRHGFSMALIEIDGDYRT